MEAPVYRMDGVLLANGFADMWDGSLATTPNRDQFDGQAGSTPGNSRVFKGSDPSGVASTSFGGPLGSVRVTTGRFIASDGLWIESGFTFGGGIPSNPNSLYALSEKLTVPIFAPEPSTIALVGAGLAGRGIVAVRRRKA